MKRLLLIAGTMLGLALTQVATATTITWTLNESFNNTTAPTSTRPWLTAVLKDLSAGTVELTLTSSLNVASEFIDEVALNINPNINLANLTITNTTSGPDNPPDVTSWTFGHNAQQLNGGGTPGSGFDIIIHWSNANPKNLGVPRFNGTGEFEKFSFSISGLSVADFNYVNEGSAAAHIAAHIQGIPTGSGSGVIKDGKVPDGGLTVILLGAALAAMGLIRRLF